MKDSELIQLVIAVVILSIVLGFTQIISGNFVGFGISILYAFIIISISVSAKKLMASKLDAGVNHKLWLWSRYGFKPGSHLKKEVPLGIILPIIGTVFSVGALKIGTILTYETSALKRRAAKRFGNYSFTEMTDFHNALVGSAGIVAVLLISFITYWIPSLEPLSKFAAYYAFWNIIPVSKLDGTQIYFGSRVLWTALALISLIFTAYALILI